MNVRGGLAVFVAGVLAVAYPILIFWGLQSFGPRQIALVGIVFLGLRWAAGGGSTAKLWGWTASAVLLAVALAFDRAEPLLYFPVLANAALLVVFGESLMRGPSLVERIARSRVGELDADEVRYCARVTAAWCVLFVVNGGIAFALAVRGMLEWWAIYNGFIAYLLIGGLFVGEYIYRQWRFRRYYGAPTDFVFRRVFPPRQS